MTADGFGQSWKRTFAELAFLAGLLVLVVLGLRGCAGALTGQEDRWPRRVGRGRHPGVEPGDGLDHRCATAERFPELRVPLRPCIDEADGEEEHGEKAERKWIAPRETGGGKAGFQSIERSQHPFPVRAPQRLRRRVGVANGHLVAKCGRRSVAECACLLDAAEGHASLRCRHTDRAENERARHDCEQGEDAEPHGIGHNAPQAEPGNCDKQADEDEQRGQPRPEALPQEHHARTQHRTVDTPPGVCLCRAFAFQVVIIIAGHSRQTTFRR